MAKTAFTKVPKTIGSSEFRASLATYLASAKKQPIVVSDRRGGGSFVVLSTDAYNKLIEAQEDAMDAAELTRLIESEKGKKFIPWESVRGK